LLRYLLFLAQSNEGALSAIRSREIVPGRTSMRSVMGRKWFLQLDLGNPVEGERDSGGKLNAIPL